MPPAAVDVSPMILQRTVERLVEALADRRSRVPLRASGTLRSVWWPWQGRSRLSDALQSYIV
jgi:hypothetical protein